MKLRFRNNSLRLRVNQREVADLAEGKTLLERIEFPGGASLAYVLQPSPGHAASTFQDNAITISAPRESIHNWAHGADIGMYFELPVNDTLLRIAIEKDLECIDAREEERDPYAFPREAGKSC